MKIIISEWMWDNNFGLLQSIFDLIFPITDTTLRVNERLFIKAGPWQYNEMRGATIGRR